VTYVALDDSFAEDDRAFGLTDKAFRLHVSAVCACSRNLTDGLISASRLATLRGQTQASQRHVNELVTQGLWRAVAAGEMFTVEGKEGAVELAATGDGYYVCGYLELNRTRAQVEALIEARREAGRRGGVAKALASASASATAFALANGLAKTYPDTDSEATENPVSREAAGDVAAGVGFAQAKLLAALTDRDDGTPGVVAGIVARGRLTEGGIYYALEEATRPGVRSRTKSAVAALKRRAADKNGGVYVS
jgi:hypothetical protein